MKTIKEYKRFELKVVVIFIIAIIVVSYFLANAPLWIKVIQWVVIAVITNFVVNTLRKKKWGVKVAEDNNNN